MHRLLPALIHRPATQRTPARAAAFTLIEIIGVLVILGIVAATVVAYAPRSTAGLVSEADQLAAHLRYAQMRALAGVAPWSVAFTDSETYQLGPSGDSPVRLPGSTGETRTLENDVSLSAPPPEVRFDAWGRPVDPADDTPLASEIVLTLTDGHGSRTVTITAGTGLIQ